MRAEMDSVKRMALVLKKHFPNLTVEQTLNLVEELLVALVKEENQ